MKVYLVEDSHMKHVFWHGILHVLMLDPKRVVLDENEKTTQKVVCRHNNTEQKSSRIRVSEPNFSAE